MSRLFARCFTTLRIPEASDVAGIGSLRRTRIEPFLHDSSGAKQFDGVAERLGSDPKVLGAMVKACIANRPEWPCDPRAPGPCRGLLGAVRPATDDCAAVIPDMPAPRIKNACWSLSRWSSVSAAVRP